MSNTEKSVVLSGTDDLAHQNLDVGPCLALMTHSILWKPPARQPDSEPNFMPPNLAAHGVVNILRLIAGRMRGTTGGTAILHITEPVKSGNPFSAMRTCDLITCEAESWISSCTLAIKGLRVRSAAKVAAAG